MRIPEKLVCDFCKGEIDPSKPRPFVRYPLSKEQREAIRPHRSAAPQGLLGIMFDYVPTDVQLDVCVGCLDGLVPMVREIAAQRVDDILTERMKKAETIPSNREDDF